jgi:hypothetical protein
MISLIIAFIIFWATNLQNRSDIGYYSHDGDSVCPFGIFMGKIGLIILIVQYYLLKYKKEIDIKNYMKILLINSFILSFMNSGVMIRLIPAFILQYLLIYDYIKEY